MATDYYAQYHSYQCQIADMQGVNMQLDAKIERLWTAKNAVITQREAIKTLNSAIWAHDPTSLWAGTAYDAYSSEANKCGWDAYAMKEDATQCIAEITNKINELENQKLDNQGIIGWLHQCANNAWTWWQNTWDDMTD
jgi:hypothetical protein